MVTYTPYAGILYPVPLAGLHLSSETQQQYIGHLIFIPSKQK
ncbi:hypothetical protein EVA_00312 [gut metagenome]|uniref:Uncharacterized protein n=1 Tax=gut metagenome TaxID=749906 RepID=J9H4H0_9ZZZZ